MSSTSVTARPKTEVQIQWPKIFPEQATTTYNSSLIFIKQLTLVAVSTITYVKNALPESCYSVDKLAGNDIRLLKSQCDDQLGNFLFRAMSQAFEAFDKKYLEQLVLCFYEDSCKPENLIEYHMFEYEYTDDGIAVSMSSKNNSTTFKCDMKDVKQRTVMMIRTCIVMVSSFQELPEHFDVSIRVYYNDNAPEGYQAPGFTSASHLEDPTEAKFFEGSKIGCIKTPFHRLMMCSYTKEDSLRASHEAVASQNTPEMTPSQILDEAPDTTTTTNNSDALLDASRTSDMNCSCSLVELDWPTLVCQHCNTRQHAACYGVLARDIQRVSQHSCVRCATGNPSRATDTDNRMYGLQKRESLAVFRCTLAWCGTVGAVSVDGLRRKFALKEISAAKLVKLLQNTGVVDPAGANEDASTRYPVNQAALSKLIKEYFRSFDDDIVDRLLDETIASQEIQPDPIAQVLGPMKQVSLQKASNIIRVVKPQDLNNNIDDPTLNKYKEALNLVDTNDTEMPLSGSHNPVKDLESVGKKRKNEKIGDKVPPKRVKAHSKMTFEK